MKRKQLKLIAICLVVAMLAVFGIGCGGNGASSDSGKKGVTITVQMYSGPESEAMLPVVDYWNKNYADETGIKVEQITMSRVGYDEKTQSQLLSGAKTPDVIHPFSLTLAKYAPYLEPLNDYLENDELMKGPDGETYNKDDMFQAAYDTVTTDDGNIYMIPKDMSEVILYYRTDLIDKAPETWDEYVELAKKFTKSINPDSPTPYGNIWQGKYELWNFCSALEVIWPYGADIFKEGTTEPNLDTPESVKALNIFKQLADAGTLIPGTENAEFPEVLAALQNGEVAMAMQWNAAYPTLNDPESSPKVAGKIAIAPPPGVKQPDGSIKRDMYIQTINLAINKNSEHKEEAFKFLAWASFGEGAELYVEHGGSSPLKSIWTAEGAQPPYNQLAEYVEKYGRAVPSHENMAEIIMIGSSWIQKLIIGDATPEQAAKGLNNEIKEFLASRE